MSNVTTKRIGLLLNLTQWTNPTRPWPEWVADPIGFLMAWWRDRVPALNSEGYDVCIYIDGPPYRLTGPVFGWRCYSDLISEQWKALRMLFALHRGAKIGNELMLYTGWLIDGELPVTCERIAKLKQEWTPYVAEGVSMIGLDHSSPPAHRVSFNMLREQLAAESFGASLCAEWLVRAMGNDGRQLPYPDPLYRRTPQIIVLGPTASPGDDTRGLRDMLDDAHRMGHDAQWEQARGMRLHVLLTYVAGVVDPSELAALRELIGRQLWLHCDTSTHVQAVRDSYAPALIQATKAGEPGANS